LKGVLLSPYPSEPYLINRIACGKVILITKNIMKRSARVRKARCQVFFWPEPTDTHKDSLDFVVGSYAIAI